MKKNKIPLSKFWFWLVVVFFSNIVLRGYGVINYGEKGSFKNINNKVNAMIGTGEYKPKNVGEFNKRYITKTKENKEFEINFKSVDYQDKNLIIDIISSNKKELTNFFNSTINLKILDVNGKPIIPSQVDFIEGKTSRLIIKGEDLKKANWVLFSFYNEESPVAFYVNKKY